MKRIITLIAAAVMMTVATNSFAQMSVGAGYLHAGDQVTLKGIDPVEVGMNGGYAGVSYNLPISELIGITPGLYYSLLYTNDSAFEGALGAKVIEHFVNVPVYLNLGFNLGQSSRFFIFAGPTGVGKTELSKALAEFKKKVMPAGDYGVQFERFEHKNIHSTATEIQIEALMSDMENEDRKSVV